MGIFRKNKESDKKAKEVLVSSLVNNMTLSEVIDLAIKASEDKADKAIKKMKGSEIHTLIEGNDSIQPQASPPKKSTWGRVKALFDSVENYIKKVFGLNVKPKKANPKKPTETPKKKLSAHKFRKRSARKEAKSPVKKKASNHSFKRGKSENPEDKSPKKAKAESKEKPENKKKP